MANSPMYYVLVTGMVEGPFPLTQLRAALETGQFRGLLRVRRDGLDEWLPLEFFSELSDLIPDELPAHATQPESPIALLKGR
ncbi:MAG TPA: DUF4339 domain-containing protein [Polyangiaceae bacterium]|nr:DUF4339 domain-containing protein [Polyangiaceae bacterium]